MTADEFFAQALPLLLSDEARHNLLLGVAGNVRSRPEAYAGARFWLVDGAAAMQTPPRELILARPRDRPRSSGWSPRSTSSCPASSGPFPRWTSSWSSGDGRASASSPRASTSSTRSCRRRQRPASTAGPDEADFDLVFSWFTAFAEEVLHERGDRRAQAHRGAPRVAGGRSRALGGRRRGRLALRLRVADAERRPDRPRLHTARVPRPRLRDLTHRRGQRAAARSRPPLLLPLHRPREPDLERDLRADRLPPRLRVGEIRFLELCL